MTLGEFLQQIVSWLYDLWPVRIVRVWEQGVRLRNGNPTKLLTSENGWFGTGLHGFWPLIGEVIVDETNVRVVETGWQTLVTLDGHPVSFSLAARFRIRDLQKFYVSIHEPDETIQNHLSAAAAGAIQKLRLDDLDEALAPAVREVAKKRLSAWGVSLLEVSLFNRVEAPTLRLLSE